MARANHPGGLCGSAMGAVVRTAKRGGSVAARFIGVHCADLGSGLRARTTSAKERVGCCEAHRGPGVERAAVQDGWRQAPAAVRGGTCGGVEGGASPGVWAARIDARRRCETVAGVRKVQGSLKTTNCSGAGSHRRAIQAKISARWGLGSGARNLGSSLGLRRRS